MMSPSSPYQYHQHQRILSTLHLQTLLPMRKHPLQKPPPSRLLSLPQEQARTLLAKTKGPLSAGEEDHSHLHLHPHHHQPQHLFMALGSSWWLVVKK